MTPSLRSFKSIVKINRGALALDRDIVLSGSGLKKLAMEFKNRRCFVLLKNGEINSYMVNLLFSSVNYRFLNLKSGQRPYLEMSNTHLTGSLSFYHDLARIYSRMGKGKIALNRMRIELDSSNFSKTVASGICDISTRVEKIKWISKYILENWAQFNDAYINGDIDLLIKLMWKSEMFNDPFLKRLQHLAFSVIKEIHTFHWLVNEVRHFTALCDYRLPEYLINNRVIHSESGKEFFNCVDSKIYLKGDSLQTFTLRALTLDACEEIANKLGRDEIMIDNIIWNLARTNKSVTTLMVETEYF